MARTLERGRADQYVGVVTVDGDRQKRDSARANLSLRQDSIFMFMSKSCICTCTTATIWRNADEKHEENNPKMPRQTNLRVLVHCFALSLHLHAFMGSNQVLSAQNVFQNIFLFIDNDFWRTSRRAKMCNKRNKHVCVQLYVIRIGITGP